MQIRRIAAIVFWPGHRNKFSLGPAGVMIARNRPCGKSILSQTKNRIVGAAALKIQGA
jgi:hypothetical protein